MILTLGFESVLEKRYYLDEYDPLGDNQIMRQEYDLGGESINTTRILKAMNVNVFTSGFLGGINGSFILNGLKDLSIDNQFVYIKDETPNYLSVFQDEILLFKLKEPSPRITRDELESFYKVYQDIVYKYKYICGLGKIPEGISKGIYFDLINMAKKDGRRFILDTSGKELELAIEAMPFMVKMSLKDLENLSKIKINFEGEMVRLGYSYIEKGIEILVIDLDEKGSIVLTKDFGYRLEMDNWNNKLNVDKGYFIAGYIFGLMRDYDIEMVMRLGQAMRLAYSINEDINTVDMGDIKKIMGYIEIRKINY